MDLASILLIVGFSGLFLILYLFWLIKRESAGTARIKEIASYIQQGANTFLKREFKAIPYFIIIFGIPLFFFLGWQIALEFIAGTFFSMLATVTGIRATVRANVRTVQKRGR